MESEIECLYDLVNFCTHEIPRVVMKMMMKTLYHFDNSKSFPQVLRSHFSNILNSSMERYPKFYSKTILPEDLFQDMTRLNDIPTYIEELIQSLSKSRSAFDEIAMIKFHSIINEIFREIQHKLSGNILMFPEVVLNDMLKRISDHYGNIDNRRKLITEISEEHPEIEEVLHEPFKKFRSYSNFLFSDALHSSFRHFMIINKYLYNNYESSFLNVIICFINNDFSEIYSNYYSRGVTFPRRQSPIYLWNTRRSMYFNCKNCEDELIPYEILFRPSYSCHNRNEHVCLGCLVPYSACFDKHICSRKYKITDYELFVKCPSCDSPVPRVLGIDNGKCDSCQIPFSFITGRVLSPEEFEKPQGTPLKSYIHDEISYRFGKKHEEDVTKIQGIDHFKELEMKFDKVASLCNKVYRHYQKLTEDEQNENVKRDQFRRVIKQNNKYDIPRKFVSTLKTSSRALFLEFVNLYTLQEDSLLDFIQRSMINKNSKIKFTLFGYRNEDDEIFIHEGANFLKPLKKIPEMAFLQRDFSELKDELPKMRKKIKDDLAINKFYEKHFMTIARLNLHFIIELVNNCIPEVANSLLNEQIEEVWNLLRSYREMYKKRFMSFLKSTDDEISKEMIKMIEKDFHKFLKFNKLTQRIFMPANTLAEWISKI